jgi:hypothetical protein
VVLTSGRGAACLFRSGAARGTGSPQAEAQRTRVVRLGVLGGVPAPNQSPLPESGAFAALILEFAVGVIVKVLDPGGVSPRRSCHDAGRWYL